MTIYDEEIYPGPSDYKPTQITGTRSFNSTIKNSPAFSMQKVPSKKLAGVMITKDHIVDLIGKDSPGVGCYDASADKIYKCLKKSPNRGVKFGTAS